MPKSPQEHPKSAARPTGRTRMTVSVPADIAEYLRSTSNASAVVCEAVALYRARELDRRLEEAYRADGAEAEQLNREWEGVDAEVSE